MESFDKWQVASLSPQDLQKLQQLEPQIHADGGQSVVLIAYQHK
jgi:hypothetical protein